MTDPVESVVEAALQSAGILYMRPERAPAQPPYLDFYLPEHGTYIECCRWHSERKVRQTAGVENVILVQGLNAARWLASLIDDTNSPSTRRAKGEQE